MEEKNLETTEEKTVPIEEQSAKSLWQQTKESWYDKVPLTVKQLDIIIACGIGGLVLTFIAIALDAMGIF
jgi:hypothetical protein